MPFSALKDRFGDDVKHFGKKSEQSAHQQVSGDHAHGCECPYLTATLTQGEGRFASAQVKAAWSASLSKWANSIIGKFSLIIERSTKEVSNEIS